jgi:hypothetical protein
MKGYELPDWFETEVLGEKDIRNRAEIPRDEFGPTKVVRLYDTPQEQDPGLRGNSQIYSSRFFEESFYAI